MYYILIAIVIDPQHTLLIEGKNTVQVKTFSGY